MVTTSKYTVSTSFTYSDTTGQFSFSYTTRDAGYVSFDFGDGLVNRIYVSGIVFFSCLLLKYKDWLQINQMIKFLLLLTNQL